MGCLQCGLPWVRRLRTFHHELLSIHMVDHVLLMAVAPPLILLGAPFRVFMHGLPQWFVREWLAGSLRWSSSAAAGVRFGSSDVLLACRYSRSHRMACSGCVRIRHAFRGVARSGVCMLFQRRTSLLVARYPALAERRAVAAVVHCFIPFLCHLAVRPLFLRFLRSGDRVVYPCYLSGTGHFVFHLSKTRSMRAP